MKFLKVLLVLIFLSPGLAAAQETVYYLFRHAEKTADSPDPGLTEEGQSRAARLGNFLYSVGVTAIFSTDYKRTRDTVGSLAEVLDMEIQIYDPRDLKGFAEQLKGMTGVIAISGHSNTTPELAALLSGQETEPMPESEYDRLYQITKNGDEFEVVILDQRTMGKESNLKPLKEGDRVAFELTLEDIEVMESQINLQEDITFDFLIPERPLSEYYRFYQAATIGNHKFVHGVFLLGWINAQGWESKKAQPINIVKEGFLPLISDGGCSVVSMRWDFSTKQLVSLYCNGLA